MEKLTLKNIVIIILSIALLLSFYLAQNKRLNYNEKEIKELHNANDSISKINERLTNMNTILKTRIKNNKILLEENKIKIIESEKKIDNLIHEKNKIYNSVYRMSASDVSKSFTNYLNERK